jgi:prolyl oligopeptidase
VVTIANRSIQVNNEVHIYSNDGTHLTRLAPDFVGSVSVSCRFDQSWLFVSMSGFTTPGIVGHYDFKKEETKRWSVYRTTLVNGLKPEDFEARQVSVFRMLMFQG